MENNKLNDKIDRYCLFYFLGVIILNKHLADAMLLMVAIIWGGGFIGTDAALKTFEPFTILMLRFGIAFLIMLTFGFKQVKNAKRKDIINGLIAGTFLFLAFAFQTFGLKYTTPSKNAFLTATNVIMVPYIMWYISKHSPKKKEIVSSLLCVTGIACLTLNADSLVLSFGDTLSLICAVFYAFHIISLSKFSKESNITVINTLQMFSAFILSLISFPIFETFPQSVSIEAWGSILYIAVFSTCLAFAMQTYAQKYTTANAASLIMCTESIFATLFSVLLLNEILTPLMIIGGCLIFISILVVELTPKK